jgi:hypothetical protein
MKKDFFIRPLFYGEYSLQRADGAGKYDPLQEISGEYLVGCHGKMPRIARETIGKIITPLLDQSELYLHPTKVFDVRHDDEYWAHAGFENTNPESPLSTIAHLSDLRSPFRSPAEVIQAFSYHLGGIALANIGKVIYLPDQSSTSLV